MTRWVATPLQNLRKDSLGRKLGFLKDSLVDRVAACFKKLLHATSVISGVCKGLIIQKLLALHCMMFESEVCDSECASGCRTNATGEHCPAWSGLFPPVNFFVACC